MRNVFLVLLLFSFSACSAERHRQSRKDRNHHNKSKVSTDTIHSVEQIVVNLATGNCVESSHVGAGGAPSEQWALYEQLREIASEQELISLCNHKNPTVRCYAFQSLAAKCADQVFQVLLSHLSDTAMVCTLSGCIGSSEMVADYFLDVVRPDYVETGIHQLNTSQRKILDSIFIYDKSIRLEARSRLLEQLKPTADKYARIREIVQVDRDVSALALLAKYQKRSDIPIIASFFDTDNTQYAALDAACEFPDPIFYPFIKKVFEQEWAQELYDYPKWRICFQALARYPGQETIDLFERVAACKDEFRYHTLGEDLIIAITKYPNRLYEPFRKKIQLDKDQAEVNR